MPIILLNERQIGSQVKNVISLKMTKLFQSAQAKALMRSQAELLRDSFAQSSDYTAIKTNDVLIGKFGFTPRELANLDRILELMTIGSNDVTKMIVKTTGVKSLTLEWVNYKKLIDHSYATHLLTKLDNTGKIVGITDVVSWVKWLEEGITISGFQFFRPGGIIPGTGGTTAAIRSRSGEGLMRDIGTGFFVLRPTRILDRIANRANDTFLRKGFKLIVRKAKI